MNEQMQIPEFNEQDKREATFHNFDNEPEVVGKLIRIEQGSYGDQYVIQAEKEETTVGTYDVLKSKIHAEDTGKFIKIVCKGNSVSPKTKRTYKDFDVFIK